MNHLYDKPLLSDDIIMMQGHSPQLLPILLSSTVEDTESDTDEELFDLIIEPVIYSRLLGSARGVRPRILELMTWLQDHFIGDQLRSLTLNDSFENTSHGVCQFTIVKRGVVSFAGLLTAIHTFRGHDYALAFELYCDQECTNVYDGDL